MSRVCHKCPLWKQVRGTDPTTGAPVDAWDCTDAWLLTGLFEIAKMAQSGAAATESFRNEMVTRADRAAITRQLALGDIPQRLIEG
jgi:hypothetical protein